MAGRESAAVQAALADVDKGKTLSEAARDNNVALSSVRRAMRRRGDPPREAPSGPAAAGYIDGRTLQRKA